MQVDFYFQLLRRFHPEVLTETLRGAVRSFIKKTNLDTYQKLCSIYDFVATADPADQFAVRGFARDMRERVDRASAALHHEGEALIRWLTLAYENRGRPAGAPLTAPWEAALAELAAVLRRFGL